MPLTSSIRLCGGILVAIPTAIPSDPLINNVGTDEGKSVITDLSKRCHEFVTTHDKQSATESAFLEGQRAVLIFIKNMINKKE